LLNDVLQIADELDVERFHLVAHDWGAILAWTLAGMEPERVASLTAISVPHPDASAAARNAGSACQQVATAYFDLFNDDNAADWFLGLNAAILRALFEDLSDEAKQHYIDTMRQPGAMRAALNWYSANSAIFRLSESIRSGPITVPTLYFWSDEDGAVCRDTAERTRNFVNADYRFEVLTGVSHWVPEEAPEPVNRALLQHLAAHPL
jgi:pimeloyl-ACP methyl ester carboxylesterase